MTCGETHWRSHSMEQNCLPLARQDVNECKSNFVYCGCKYNKTIWMGWNSDQCKTAWFQRPKNIGISYKEWIQIIKSSLHWTSFEVNSAAIHPIHPSSITTSTGQSRILSQYSAAATFHCSKGQTFRPALLSQRAPFTCPHDSCDHVTSFLNLRGSMSVWGFFTPPNPEMSFCNEGFMHYKPTIIFHSG